MVSNKYTSFETDKSAGPDKLSAGIHPYSQHEYLVFGL